MTDDSHFVERLTRKGSLAIVVPVFLALFLGSCASKDEAAEGKPPEGRPADQAERGWFSGVFVSKEKVPEGHKVYVRLEHSVSSGKNKTGDHFSATLDRSIVVNGKIVAQAGSPAKGRLSHVDDSDRVKGRAEMAMKLEEIVVDGKTYDLKTLPLRFRAEGTKKQDAAKIGAGAAIGAAVGAIAGGGDGAAKGAAIGAGAGTGVVLATKGKEVEFGPETRLAFTVTEAVELPVQKERQVSSSR